MSSVFARTFELQSCGALFLRSGVTRTSRLCALRWEVHHATGALWRFGGFHGQMRGQRCALNVTGKGLDVHGEKGWMDKTHENWWEYFMNHTVFGIFIHRQRCSGIGRESERERVSALPSASTFPFMGEVSLILNRCSFGFPCLNSNTACHHSCTEAVNGQVYNVSSQDWCYGTLECFSTALKLESAALRRKWHQTEKIPHTVMSHRGSVLPGSWWQVPSGSLC